MVLPTVKTVLIGVLFCAGAHVYGDSGMFTAVDGGKAVDVAAIRKSKESLKFQSSLKSGISRSHDDVGFNLLFQSNREEMTNVPVHFQHPLPRWLHGTLVRNGLGLFENGDRTFTHTFDGFAKLASWRFYGNSTVLFSTRFLRSAFYKSSIKEKTISPFLLFQTVAPPFSYYERMKCLVRGIDNMNVNIYEFLNPKTKQLEYAALSDFWIIYKVSAEKLSTKSRIIPRIKHSSASKGMAAGVGFLNLLSSAHPLPEPGTNNHLTFLSSVAMFPWESSVISLIRMKSLKRRKIIAQWQVDRVPYMHSFSVTQTKAIILASPFYVNVFCMVRRAEPFSCLDWYPNEGSTLYVINLKSGKVRTIKMANTFTMHHVNAYDLNRKEIIMDISSYPNPDFVNHLQLHIVRDPVKRNELAAAATLKRIHINLSKLEARVFAVDSDPSPSLASFLDMPVINEAYRSIPYCFVYGLVIKTDNISLSKIAIVKKDMCHDGHGDRVWELRGNYPVEPWFVSRPQAQSEDDGLLLVPVLDGSRKVSYLAILDAKNLTLVNRADMPTYIPYSLHGRFF